MKGWMNESGQTVIMAALCMPLLLGFVALAVDVGVTFRAQREMQTAADAGAVAGAAEISYGDVTTAATASTALNGVTDKLNGATVTVNNPPASGPHTGDANYVEVIVTKSQPTYFMNVFNHGSMTVLGRAVAGHRPSNACIYVLDPTAPQAMQLQGSFDVSTPGCGVIVNSNAPNALQFTGAGGTLSAGSVAVNGGVGGQIGDSNPPPVPGVAAQSDPLAFVPAPAYDTSSCGPVPPASTIGPATSGGTVCYSGNVTLSNKTLNPGVYVFTGNVSFSGTVTGSGVTFYLLGGLDASNGTLSLSAPPPGSGPYSGLLIFAARTNSSSLTFDKGNASGTLDGVIYAPDSEMDLNDSGGDKNGGLQFTTDLVVKTLYDKTATLVMTSYSGTVTDSPLSRVGLVE